MTKSIHPVLIDGEWRESLGTDTFAASNPSTGATIDEAFPVSPWGEIETAVQAAHAAFEELRSTSAEVRASFLDKYADLIDERADEISAKAHEETGLPVEPRLKNVELPRTTNQLRQAAAAAREGSWAAITIDSRLNIRSMLSGIGPVCVFGPNNFPLAFNSVSGGDFAAAIAAGNPVIGKANSSHPGTTRLLAEAAQEAVDATGAPRALIQLIYRTKHEDGERLVSHPLVGATGYTGSQSAGLALKAAADRAGKPIYLELSSINPVVILPGALRERGDALVDEFVTSCLMGAGQFCTNPGLVLLLDDDAGLSFVESVRQKFADASVGTLLSEGVRKNLSAGIQSLVSAGAELLTGGQTIESESRFCCQNTLLRVSGEAFLQNAEALQAEAFGNESLMVMAAGPEQLLQILEQLEGNLTGCFYSHTGGDDDVLYDQLAPALRQSVGRLLNDKMPTGVAVSPAMNHGGPYPATGHPGFTAVGMPTAITRFCMLQCYDNVREHRLPSALQNRNPNGMWRNVDGAWTQADVGND